MLPSPVRKPSSRPYLAALSTSDRTFRVTVRYGSRRQRYHTFQVDAEDVVQALRAAAGEIPDEISGEADLVEIRPLTRPDDRRYVGEEEK